MKKLFLFIVAVVCGMMAMPILAEVTTERPECVAYAPGRIEVKGTTFDVLNLQAEPHVEVAVQNVKGKPLGGNTVFEYTPHKDLTCFTFKSGAKWALIDMKAVKQWSLATNGKIGGAKVYKDNTPQGYCLRVRGEGEAEVVRLDEFTD